MSATDPRPSTYDAIVVGGGHNGLVAAAYVARAGLRVCARTPSRARRRVRDGGGVAGCRVPRVAYVESFLQPKVVRELRLEAFGYQSLPVDPGFATVTGDGTPLFFHRDPRATWASLARHSRHDAARHPEFQALVQRLVRFLQPLLLRSPPRPGSLEAGDLMTMLQAGARAARLGRRDREELARMVTGSVGDLVDAWFESDGVKAVWASTGVIGAWAGPRTPGTAYNLLYHAVGRIDRIGGLWGHVRGGVGAISEAIAASARAAGVEIRTSAIVRSIDVAAGRAHGVTLGDGTELRAPIVLSNVHPHTTILHLVGAGHFPDEVVDDLRRLRTRGGSVKINCSLSAPPCFAGVSEDEQSKLLRTGVAICDSVEHIERAWQEARAGQPATEPHIEMQVPSAVDPTLTDDDSQIMLSVRPVRAARPGGVGRGRARGLRAAMPAGREDRTERARVSHRLGGPSATGPRGALRPRRRIDLSR